MSNRLALAVTLSLVAGLATSVYAQTQKEPPLKGPAVKDGGVPGEQRRFGGGGGEKRKDTMGQATPYPVFLKAMDVLKGDKATSETRLTSDQESKIRSIEREYREGMEKYRAEHKDEIKQLREQLPPNEQKRVDELLRAPGQRPGGRPDKAKEPKTSKESPKDAAPEPMKDSMQDTMKDTDEAQADKARARLRELAEGMPKPADSQARVYAVLTEPQKKAFNAELERVRAETAKSRESKKPASGTAKPPQKLDESKLPERVRERLKNATPEEREQILKQLEARRTQRKPQ